MTDTTVLPPARAGKRRARGASSHHPRHRGVDLPRRRDRRRHRERADAETVLHRLIHDGDLYDVAGRRFLVAPITDSRMDELIGAMAASEDDEPSGDTEPSLAGINAVWSPGVSGEDLEGDNDCDAEEDDPGGGNVEDEGEADFCDAEPSLVASTGSGRLR
jgi:hypothetical protein